MAARDRGVSTCNLRRARSMIVRAVGCSRLIPDEGEIFPYEGVGHVDGWILGHLRFVLEVRWQVEAKREPGFQVQVL